MIFDEDTPLNLITKIKPDVLVKGADYKGKEVVGSDIAKEVRLIDFVEGKSTTGIIKRIKDAKFDAAGLSFNYVCKNCKNSFPMHFYRCPVCHELGSVKILSHITEKASEDSNTF